MLIIRFFVAIIGSLLVCLVIAFVSGMILAMLFPPSGPFLAGITPNWRNIPGTALGMLAGIQSFRASLCYK